MADYSTFSCPTCSAKLKRSEDVVAGVLVKCPRCNTEFNVPEEAHRPRPVYNTPAAQPERDYGRPPPPRYRDHEPDEDAAPRERREYGGYYGGGGRTADNYGNYEVNIGAWFGQASSRWGEFVGPAIGYFFLSVLMMIVTIVPVIGPILAFIFAPAVLYGPYYAAVRVLRRERWEFNDFFYGFQRWGSL